MLKELFEEGKTIEVEGIKILFKEYPKSILIIKHNGDRDKVKKLIENKFYKPVSFLGELLSLTG